MRWKNLRLFRFVDRRHDGPSRDAGVYEKRRLIKNTEEQGCKENQREDNPGRDLV